MASNGDDRKPTSSRESWDPQVEHVRKEPRPANLSEPLPRTKLPKELQKALDADDETMWETFSEGHAPESTDTNVRYAGYAARLRTIMLAAHRYVAYVYWHQRLRR